MATKATKPRGKRRNGQGQAQAPALAWATRRRCRIGLTIPEASRIWGWGEGTTRRGIAAGDIRYVEFAGVKVITPAEIARVSNLLGRQESAEAE
jgi:hypothetical protein